MRYKCKSCGKTFKGKIAHNCCGGHWTAEKQWEELDEDAKWKAIIQANPVLAQPNFTDNVAKWNALKDAADKAGLSREEAVRFISAGMDK